MRNYAMVPGLPLMAALVCLVGLAAGCRPVCAATPAVLDLSQFTATFADEFDRFDWRDPNPARQQGMGTWTTNFLFRPENTDDIGNRTLTNNGELELYIDRGFRGTGAKPLGLDPFSIEDGRLVITADRAPTAALPYLSGFRYTSGVITTRKTFTQTYGLFEIRARMPKGQGLWPAFWLLPADGSWPPEIDVLEFLENKPSTLYTSVHTRDAGQGDATIANQVSDSTTAFHTYSVDWEPDEIVFYVDGREVSRKPTPSDLHKPAYLLANLAVGGKWPGSPDQSTKFPARFEIDWIHVYKRHSSK